jgi:hypothetical protein
MKRLMNGSALLINTVFGTLALSFVIGGASFAEEPPTPGRLPSKTAPPPAIAPTVEKNSAIARVTPISGKIDLRLRNNSGTRIIFEAAGFSSPTTLTSGQSMTFHSLPTPITVKIARVDGGFVQVRPIENASLGTLELTIDEGDEDAGVMKIQPNGNVFIRGRQPGE